MTRKNICDYEAGRGEECLYGRGKTGKQIKKLLLLFAVIVALCCANGYAVEKCLKSIDDEDGMIRSNEDSGEDNHIRVGTGESDDRSFIGIVSFDTTVLDGVAITDACLVLTVENAHVWDNPAPNPDQWGPTVDLDEAFHGDIAFEIPEDRDATAAEVNCAEPGPWGMQGLENGERAYIHLTAEAINAINTSGRTQFRINTGSFSGPQQDDAMDFYDGGNGANSAILWINPSTDEIVPWPEFGAAVADDPNDEYGGLNNGDRLTLAFDMNTNEPLAGTKAQIDGLIDFGGKSLGTDYTGVWTDVNVLVITVTNATGGDLAIGDTIAIKADGTEDLKNQAETSSAPSETSTEVSGVWGPVPPEISDAVASDPDHDDPALNDGDMLTLTFDVNTNEPSGPILSKADIDGLIDFGGKSLGLDYTGVWTDASTLAITVVDASGGNLAIGDTIAIIEDGTEDLKNEPETSLGSTSSGDVSGYWGPVIRDLYVGLEDYNGAWGPALAHVQYDPSQDEGDRYTVGDIELQDANVTHIEVDASRNGQGGGIYIAIDDGSEPNEGTQYLKEYRYDGGGNFISLRQDWEDIADIAVSPADYGLYGFETTVGKLVMYEPNGASFLHAGETYEDVNGVGEVAIGVDGWIHALYYGGQGDDRLEVYTYNEGQEDPFSAQAAKEQSYVVDEMLMSPLDNTVLFDNKEEQGGALEQNAYQYQGLDGYETVSQTPYDDPNGLMPGVTDIAMLSDGTVIAIDVNTYLGDGNVSLMAWRPDPHTFADGDGQMDRLAIEVLEAATDVNAMYYLAVDEDDTIHVLGNGMLRAYRLNSDEGNFDDMGSLEVTGSGTEVAASVYREPGLPSTGVVYDLYDDYTFNTDDMANGNWQYMDPCEVLLVNDEYLDVNFMCGNPDDGWSEAWSYPDLGSGTGPWDYDPNMWLLPWLNQGDCLGGDQGEVLTFGPLLIRWTAPEAGDNVEISGHLWQVNNEEHNTENRQIAYILKHNDDVLDSGAVVSSEDGNTLGDRDNTVDFDDDGSTIVIAHVDVNDTITLLIDGSGPEGNDETSWGYASLRIAYPKCWFGLVGDLDKDCKVDIADVNIFATNWLTDGEPDYVHDSTVNFKDYRKLAGSWLTDCGDEPGSAGCVPFIKSIMGEDGFIGNDGQSERDRIRVGDDGSGVYFNSVISFDTRPLEGVEITRAWIGLTVMNRYIWDPCSTPDPDKLNLTLDLRTAFNNDTALETPADFAAAADVADCAVEDDWGLTEAAVDEQVLIELNAAAIAAINTSGRTQFRINTPASDDVPPYGTLKADAIDIYAGGEDRLDKAPVLIVE